MVAVHGTLKLGMIPNVRRSRGSGEAIIAHRALDGWLTLRPAELIGKAQAIVRGRLTVMPL